MSQNSRVLDYMKNHVGLTNRQALNNLGIGRLSARIFDLRQLGYKIVSVEREDINRYGETSRYTEYRLTE